MGTESLHSPEQHSFSSHERLLSWKEIASYLNCSERTVRRWEQEGLPVHRHVHKNKAAIYAYKSEIDVWWNNGHERLVSLKAAAPHISTPVSTPAPVVLDSHSWWTSRRLTGLVAAAALFAIATLLMSWIASDIAPRVESVKQLTNDAVPKEGRLATDGARVYFNEGQSGSWSIAQVSAKGGKTAPVNTNFKNLQIADFAPDNATLLVLVGGVIPPYDAWLLPVPAGDPHPLSEIKAQDASFFPDGRIAFAQGPNLYVADKDGLNPRRLAQTKSPVWDLDVSADGKRIVFNSSSLQEITEAAGVREVLGSDWKLSGTCCAKWTPDDKFLVFQADEDDRSDLWVLPQYRRLFGNSRPVRLTRGPLSYTNPVPSLSGKEIFAIGTERRGELIRYDEQARNFVPYLSGISATDVTFSADSKWVSYLAYPGHTLWRSRGDGSQPLQLTYLPNIVIYPMISPDGTRVAFGMANAVYVMSIDRGSLRKVAGDSIAGTWSPDGESLLLTSSVSSTRSVSNDIVDTVNLKNTDIDQTELRIADLRTGKISDVPDSRGKVGAFWAGPTTLVAATKDNAEFVICDLRTKKWKTLASGSFVNWMITLDRKSLYFTTGGSDPSAMRIRLSDGLVEKVVSLKGIRRVVDSVTGTQMGVTSDGSVLLTRDVGLQEIFALSVSW